MQPKHARPSLVAAVAASLIVLALAAAGCAPKTIVSAWPPASTERTVASSNGTPTWPLTGLSAPSAAARLIRVVSVKIENAPAARPQSGLDQADVVYETLTEGGITRFNALFQSHTPKTAGPVRSARPSDFAVVPQYHALFAHVGGDSLVRKELANHTVYDDMDQFFDPGPYVRVPGRPAPHNVYVDLTKLRAAAVKRGYVATEAITGLAFAGSVAEATPTVTLLTVPFSSSNRVTWRYDAASRMYARAVNGKPHVDKLSGKQYKARNIVVLWARTSSFGTNGVLREITLTGTGRASVFLSGVRYDGTWTASADAPPLLRGPDGRVIRLDPGNTWFEVIGNELDILMN
jgi:hypothetical protein